MRDDQSDDQTALLVALLDQHPRDARLWATAGLGASGGVRPDAAAAARPELSDADAGKWVGRVPDGRVPDALFQRQVARSAAVLCIPVAGQSAEQLRAAAVQPADVAP